MVTKSQTKVEQHVATENVVTYAGQLDFEFKTWSPNPDHEKQAGILSF